MEWEILIQVIEETARLRVEGGWIYRYGFWSEELGYYVTMQMCFVPGPVIK